MPNDAADVPVPPTPTARVAASRGTTAYYMAALFAAAAMAWYFLFFVPSKLEYFVGLKLRALAVASGQLKTKAENLASSLNLARSLDRSDQEGDNTAAREYLWRLVPDIRLVASSSGLQGLRLSAQAPPAPPSPASQAGQPSTRLDATVAWEDLAAQAAAVSESDFEDLILALPSGRVVWQREQTTPRIGNLAQVLYADTEHKGWFSFDWSPRPELPASKPEQLPEAVAIRPVTVGGSSRLLVVQAVPLVAAGIEPLESSPPAGPRGDVTLRPAASAEPEAPDRNTAADRREHTLYVAGLVSMSELQAQARSIPIAWVVLLSLPVVLLFLALPCVKLATLTSRERFSFVDAVLLLVATVATAGLAATIPLTEVSVDEEVDRALSDFANALDSRMAEDASAALRVAKIVFDEREDDIARKQWVCVSEVSTTGFAHCNLWPTIERRAGQSVSTEWRNRLDLDNALWVDDRGRQVAKWSTKTQVTGFAYHNPYQHFHDLVERRLWRLASPSPGVPDGLRFTIEPLRTPTTSELGVVVAVDAAALGASATSTPQAQARLHGDARDTATYFVLNLRPRSVLDAVVPPDHGFAILAEDGRVLFHSLEYLSLEENFFEEVGDPDDVRARALSGRAVSWSGDYHGRPHRLHLQPVSGFKECPWRIVTFLELEPSLAAVIAHQAGSFRLAALNMVALMLLLAIAGGRAGMRGRSVRDVLNLRPVRHPLMLALHLLLLLVAVGLVLATYTPGAGVWLDAMYLFFVVLPFAALGVSALARRPAMGQAPAGRWARLLESAELCLLVLLVAAVPAAGFTRLVHGVQTTQRNVRWLEQTQQAIAARNARVLARVSRPSYGASAAGSGFPNFEALEAYSYLDVAHIERAPAASPEAGRVAPGQGQTLVQAVLNWNPFPSPDRPGLPAVTTHEGGLRLASVTGASPALAIGHAQTDRVDSVGSSTASAGEPIHSSYWWLPRARIVFGLLLLAATIAALYWARRKLLAHAPADAPALEQVLALRRDRRKQGIMLIGPPRTGKEGAVDRALAAIGQQVDRRIRLLDSVHEPDFIDVQLNGLWAHPALTSWWHPGMGPEPLPSAPRYIHVSNLESYLVDAAQRAVALKLLERLLEEGADSQPRVLIVSTNVDPIAHFEEIFDEERRGIYEDPIPEVALSRFALLLTRFHRCYLPLVVDDGGDDPWPNYRASQWQDVLKWEARATPLQSIGQEIADAWLERRTVPRDELERAIAMRSYALYELLWTSCTRREKLVLVQLAQEGFVTRQSADIVAALIAKGLIVRRPGPAIFNHTFRTFLRRIERSDVVREWERMDGQGLWVVAGRLIASSLVAGGLFFLLTQGYSVEGLLPVLSGTGVFGAPLLRSLFARVTGRSSDEVAV
jgi:hypothetical protein